MVTLEESRNFEIDMVADIKDLNRRKLEKIIERDETSGVRTVKLSDEEVKEFSKNCVKFNYVAKGSEKEVYRTFKDFGIKIEYCCSSGSYFLIKGECKKDNRNIIMLHGKKTNLLG